MGNYYYRKKKKEEKPKERTEPQKAATARLKNDSLKKQDEFLDEYLRTGDVAAAANNIGIVRGTHYNWLRKSAMYRERFAGIEAAVADIKVDKFIESYVNNGFSIVKAINDNKVSRTWHYSRLNNDPEYAAKFRASKELMADIAETEAFNRAVVGVDVPIYDKQGNQVGAHTEKSDMLLAKILEAYKPEYSKRNNSEVNVNVSVNTPEELKACRARVREAQILKVENSNEE